MCLLIQKGTHEIVPTLGFMLICYNIMKRSLFKLMLFCCCGICSMFGKGTKYSVTLDQVQINHFSEGATNLGKVYICPL